MNSPVDGDLLTSFNASKNFNRKSEGAKTNKAEGFNKIE